MCSTRNCRACPRNSVRSSCSATWTDRRRRRSPVNPANWTTNALAMEVNTSGRDSAFSAVTQGNCSFDDRENEHHPASIRERSAQPPCRRERTDSWNRQEGRAGPITVLPPPAALDLIAAAFPIRIADRSCLRIYPTRRRMTACGHHLRPSSGGYNLANIATGYRNGTQWIVAALLEPVVCMHHRDESRSAGDPVRGA